MVSAAAARLTFILSLVAAALALTAAVIRYSKDGRVEWSLIAAAVFLVVFGLGARGREGGPVMPWRTLATSSPLTNFTSKPVSRAARRVGRRRRSLELQPDCLATGSARAIAQREELAP
jgi:hypothetical protein